MKVNRIVNESVNSGVKNGKQWSQASVELSDGQIVRIFNPVMVGDTVTSEQNGQYTNWKVVNKVDNGISGDTEKLINSMSADIQTLVGRVEVLEAHILTQEKIAKEVESRVYESEEMPSGFLKNSYKLENK
jgi:hypothetical protein